MRSNDETVSSIYKGFGHGSFERAHIPIVGIDAALFLGMLNGWYSKADDDGWIWHSAKTIQVETGLTEKQQRRVRNKLVALGWIEEAQRGTTHWDRKLSFRPMFGVIDRDVLRFDYADQIGGIDTAKSAGSMGPKVPLSNAPKVPVLEPAKSAGSITPIDTSNLETQITHNAGAREDDSPKCDPVGEVAAKPNLPVTQPGGTVISNGLGEPGISMHEGEPSKRAAGAAAQKSKDAAGREAKQKREADLVRRFGILWAAWPNKTGEKRAREAFLKLDPDKMLLTMIKDAVNAQVRTHGWVAGDRFVPMLANWLRDERWNDEVPKVEPMPKVTEAPRSPNGVRFATYGETMFPD